MSNGFYIGSIKKIITMIFYNYGNLYFIKFVLEYCKYYVKNTTFYFSFHYALITWNPRDIDNTK